MKRHNTGLFGRSLVGSTLAAGLLVALAIPAAAAEVSNSETVELRFFQGDGGGVLDQFDPALGTLTSAAVTVDGTLNYTICVDNQDQQGSQAASAQPGGLLEVDIAAQGVVDLNHVDVIPEFSLDTGDGEAECLIDEIETPVDSPDVFYSANVLSESGTATFSGADLVPFIGTGTVPFTHAASSQSGLSGMTNFNVAFRAHGGYVVKVTYTYDEAPTEPPTESTPTPTESTTTPQATPSPTTPQATPSPTAPQATPSTTPPPTSLSVSSTNGTQPATTVTQPTTQTQLSRTGFEVAGLTALALAAVALGGTIVWGVRRRDETPS